MATFTNQGGQNMKKLDISSAVVALGIAFGMAGGAKADPPSGRRETEESDMPNA